jgi:hypothetical protein
MLLSLVLVCGALSFAAYGQVSTIDKFDTPFTYTTSNGGGKCYLRLSTDSTDKAEGSASLKARARLDSLFPWGTYAQFGIAQKAGDTPWDFSSSDSLSLWLKVRMAPQHPQWMSMRVELIDQPNPGDAKETYIYQIDGILDNVSSGWVQLRIPIIERVSTGSEAPDSTGFIVAPSNWGGLTWNNRKLDRDKIVEWEIVLVTTPPPNPTSGNIPSDSIEVSFDNFVRYGARSFPVTLFNGIVFTPPVTNSWSWGNASMSVEAGAGPVANSNAVKFVEGDGWSGWGVDMASTIMTGAWKKDSLQMMIKAEAGGDDTLRAQFESANGKRAIKFKPIRDNAWHTYKFSLRDMMFNDGAPNFDTSAVIKFGLMSNANAGRGKINYVTNVWTGNAVLDVIPPNPVTGLAAAGSSGGFSNVISWNPTNKANAKYTVYYKNTSFTSVTDSTVEDLMPNNSPATTATHILLAPNTDQDVTFYYGIVATDASGNQSKATISKSSVTTKAKGVPTIALAPPASFTADGNLSEWTSSGITPIVLSVVSGTAHGVPNYLVTDDNDLKVTAYLAIDASNLYVAFDVVDNVVIVDTTAANDYEQDCPDLMIGLYDWRGKHHASYLGGATPDYHLRFSLNRIRLDQNGGAVLMYASTAAAPNPNYTWKKKTLTPGYTVEAKIPFATIAKVVTGRDADRVFVPKEGMRIPFDFAINDRDAATPSTRHAIMGYSPISNDNSWSAPTFWTNTWIGNKFTGVHQETAPEIPQRYELSQNYPNPFNPSTEIQYSLQNSGLVTLRVFDILGREVASLVHEFQNAGTHTVQFTSTYTSNTLASGVYFYRLESGSFTAIKKMLLLK